MLPTPVFLGFPGGSAGKESSWSVGDLGLIRELGRSLKISWRREWLPTPVFWPGEFCGLFHGVTKSGTRLSDFNFTVSMTIPVQRIQSFQGILTIKRKFGKCISLAKIISFLYTDCLLYASVVFSRYCYYSYSINNRIQKWKPKGITLTPFYVLVV